MRNSVLILVLILSACSSVTRNMEIATENSPQTEVIIIRPSAFPAAANGMLIGFNDKYFGSLRNKQYMKVKMNSGDYVFQVKANGSPSSSYMATLNPNERICLQSNINPAVVGVTIIPLVANMVSWFQLSEVECPDDEFFTEYSEVQKS